MRDLSRLLRPKSIALFGGAWAENVIVQLQKAGFSGDIWPVHPKRESMRGIACFRDMDALPSTPDASFVGVNRKLSVDVIARLSKMGAGGAICFASGFLESEAENAGGADLQRKLVEAAGDMPILGPNCYGLLNYIEGATIWPDQHGGRPVEKGVAIVGQSSNILINMTMQKRGLPVFYVIAAGNQAQTSISELGQFLLEDDRVTAIGLYIEGFGDLKNFEKFARLARERRKPIVAIKSGKSTKSREATMTHTASLAGGAAASTAFLKRLGIVEVESIAVFLETLKLLHVLGPLKGPSICSMSCSGGEAGLVGDMAETTNIEFSNFSPIQRQALKDVLGPLVTIANPLDYHTYIWSDMEKLTTCYEAALSDRFDLNMLIMDIPPQERCDASAWDGPLDAIIEAKRRTDAPTALLATLPENISESLCDRLLENGIVPLCGMEEAVLAIDATIRAGMLAAVEETPVIIRSISSNISNRCTLDEAASKAALAEFGLNFPKSVSASTPEKIADASKGLTFPVALKGLGIAHKSEAGAVALHLKDERAVQDAAAAMKGVSGFLAEEMVSGSIAELLVGITRDETGLLLLTVGAGGIMTELLADTACLLLPASRTSMAEALKSLKTSDLLTGFRGKPAANLERVLDAVEAIQNYCLASRDIVELDVNPLMVRENDVLAVDALIVKGGA